MIANIALDQFKALGQAAEAGRKIVINDYAIASAAQSPRNVTADVACTSNHENGQWNTSLSNV